MTPSESREVFTAIETRRLIGSTADSDLASPVTRKIALSRRVMYTVLSSGGKASVLRTMTDPGGKRSQPSHFQFATAVIATCSAWAKAFASIISAAVARLSWVVANSAAVTRNPMITTAAIADAMANPRLDLIALNSVEQR